MKRAFTCLALAALSYSAFGQAELLGTWKGKAQLDVSKMPKPKNADQQKRLNAFTASVKKMSVVITFKKGGLYHATVSNAPGPQGKLEEDGTWKVNKNVVVTMATKQNGKAPQAGEKPQNLNWDKAQKHLVLTQGIMTMTFAK